MASTASLASARPSPVASRISLIAAILLPRASSLRTAASWSEDRSAALRPAGGAARGVAKDGGRPERSPRPRLPADARPSRDTVERLSYLLGIYKALQILLPETEAADGWVRRPNQAAIFGGRSALERMLGGNVGDLLVVRQYLDAMRGGWA